MTARFVSGQRVLAVVPKSRGFGFIVMESQTTPIDWGSRGGRGDPHRKEIATLAKIQDLLDQYSPSAVILEKIDARSHRGDRIRLLLESIHNLAVWRAIKIRRISFGHVKSVFQVFNAFTKHDIAVVIAHQLPELEVRIPPQRRPWMSEDHRMAIFDAAALALAFFYTRLGTRNKQLAGGTEGLSTESARQDSISVKSLRS